MRLILNLMMLSSDESIKRQVTEALLSQSFIFSGKERLTSGEICGAVTADAMIFATINAVAEKTLSLGM